jgi:hypothetical protein
VLGERRQVVDETGRRLGCRRSTRTKAGRRAHGRVTVRVLLKPAAGRAQQATLAVKLR